MQTSYQPLQRFQTFKDVGRKIKLSLHVKVSAILILLLVIPFTAIFLTPLIEIGETGILFLQQKFLNELKWETYFKIATDSCGPLMFARWSAVLYFLLDPRPGVKVIAVGCAGSYVCYLLNMLYGEPRPYWESERVKAVLCENGFGEPSVELFLAVVFYFYLVIQLLRKGGSYCLSVVAYSFLALVLCFQALGEVVLGAHFPHQVVITACYAFIFLTFVLSQDSLLTRWCYRCAFGYEKNRKYSVYLVLLAVSLVVVAIIVGQIASPEYLPSKWLMNAAKGCEKSEMIETYSSVTLLLYGAAVLTGSMHTSKSLHEFWWNTPLWKGLVRTCLALAFQEVVFRLAANIQQPSEHTQQAQLTYYVFGEAALMMVVGYILTGILPACFRMLELTEPDLSRECVI